MTNITQNEFIALKTCLNYDNLETQLMDNYSNGGPVEFMAALGWSEHQVAGLMTSLQQKGLGWLDDRSGDSLPHKTKLEDHIFWLTDEGTRVVFEEIEKRRDSREILA